MQQAAVQVTVRERAVERGGQVEELFDPASKHAGWIRALARRCTYVWRLRDQSVTVDDMVQESYMALWQAQGKSPYDKRRNASVKSWAYHVIRNHLIDEVQFWLGLEECERKQKRRPDKIPISIENTSCGPADVDPMVGHLDPVHIGGVIPEHLIADTTAGLPEAAAVYNEAIARVSEQAVEAIRSVLSPSDEFLEELEIDGREMSMKSIQKHLHLSKWAMDSVRDEIRGFLSRLAD